MKNGSPYVGVVKNNPLRHYLADQAHEARELSNAHLLSEAKNIYLPSKGDCRPVTFAQAVDRAVNNLVSTVVDKPIDTYSRQDANLLRNSLFDRCLNKASVKRMFGTIRA